MNVEEDGISTLVVVRIPKGADLIIHSRKAMQLGVILAIQDMVLIF